MVSAEYRQARENPTQVELCVKPGALGMPWVSGCRLVWRLTVLFGRRNVDTLLGDRNHSQLTEGGGRLPRSAWCQGASDVPRDCQDRFAI